MCCEVERWETDRAGGTHNGGRLIDEAGSQPESTAKAVPS